MNATPGSVGTRNGTPPWRQRFDTFWRWWSAELVRLVPERFSSFTGKSRSPLVRLDGDTLVLLDLRGTALADVSQSPLGTLDLEGRRIALRNLLSGAGETQMRVRLVLEREESLLRRVSLPLATEENLAQVLAFEMDRLSPFRAEDVYFGFRIAGRDPATGKVHVDLAVARRALVDERLAKLREWGASVQGVVLADDAARSASPMDLLPESQRGERTGGGLRRLQLGLATAVLILFTLVLVFPLWQKREAVIGLMPVVGKARAEAEATDKLARELERGVSDYNFLLSKKHANQPTLAFIEEISRLLPDTTWVQQLDIRPAGKVREVQIMGETPSSSKLIEIFEQSVTMKNAAPRGSVTRGSQPGTERFLIAAEAKPRTLPEPVPVGATVAPLGVAPPVVPPGVPGSATAAPAPSGSAPTAVVTVPPVSAPAPAPAPAPAAPAPAARAPASQQPESTVGLSRVPQPANPPPAGKATP